MLFACEVWCIADVSSVSPSADHVQASLKRVCSDVGLTFETLAAHAHQTSQAKNITYQPFSADQNPYMLGVRGFGAR